MAVGGLGYDEYWWCLYGGIPAYLLLIDDWTLAGEFRDSIKQFKTAMTKLRVRFGNRCLLFLFAIVSF